MASEEKDGSSKSSIPVIINGQVIFSSLLLSSVAIGGFYTYRKYLRRIPNSSLVPESFLQGKRSMLGYVTSVGDADNFHFFHTPGGYLAGWGWLRTVPAVNARGLAKETLHVRLNGVDAPEGAHFGKPAQKFSGEALAWLRSYILGRRVRVRPLARDQYQRTVGEAHVWKWTGRKNVSLEMLHHGWGVVYEGKVGAEFNGNEEKFRAMEKWARQKRIGMWKDGNVETPGEYKRKYK